MKLLVLLCVSWTTAAAGQSPETTDPAQEAAVAEERVDGSEPLPDEPIVIEAAITVTASRGARDVLEEPATVDLISAEDIRNRKLVGNFVDVLHEISAVSVQKTAQGQGSPYIRGFTGFLNLMMVDGVRLNNSVLRSGPNQYWATVDALGGSRVELVKGPGAVLWGSDSIGGTVNLITRSALPVGTPGWSARGDVYARWAQAEQGTVGRAEAAGSYGDRFSYQAGISVKEFGDFRAGGDTGTVVNSAYGERGADAKLQLYPGDDQQLTLLVQSYRQDDVPRTETTIFSKPFHGTSPGSELRRDLDQERFLSYLAYSRAPAGSVVEQMNLTLSYQETAETRWRVRADERSDHSGFDVGTLGLQAHFRSSTPRGQLTYGVDYYRDSVDSFRTDFNPDGSVARVRIQGPVADDASYQLFDVYLQDELTLAEERLTVLVGARFSHQELDARRVEDPLTGLEIAIRDDWSTVLGSIRALWRLDSAGADRWRLFASVGQAFRAPNLSDVTRLDATSAVETPTLGLEPERYLAVEVGAKLRSPHATFSGAVFRTSIEDQIVQSPTGRFFDDTPEVRKDNVGDGFVRGVEVAGSWRSVGGLELWGNASWMEGQVDQFLFAGDGTATEVRAPVSRLIPWMANAGVIYTPARGGWWLEAHGTAFSDADELALRDIVDTRRIPPGGTPGFTVLGLRGSRVFPGQGLTVSVGLENLFDEEYRIHGSGQNMPGRNLVVGLEWEWD